MKIHALTGKGFLVFLVLSFFSLKSHPQESKIISVGILPITSNNWSYSHYYNNVYAQINMAFAGKSRFTLVDRSLLDQIAKERNLQKQEDYLNGYVAEQGKSIGAQYLATANIIQTEVKRYSVSKSRSKQNPSTGQWYTENYQMPAISGNIVLHVQLIDVSTGKVHTSNNITGHNARDNSNNAYTEGSIMELAIQSFGTYYRQWVNQVFPVIMKIVRVEETDKKGRPKKVLITGGQDMDIQKQNANMGDWWGHSSVLEVYEVEVIEADGKKYYNKKVFGELTVHEIKGTLTVCNVEKGKEEIQQRINEGKPIYVSIRSY